MTLGYLYSYVDEPKYLYEGPSVRLFRVFEQADDADLALV